MLQRIVNRVKRGLNEVNPRTWKWRRELALRDADFDAQFGVDTTTGQSIGSLTIHSPNRAHSCGHIASHPDEFTRSMAALQIPYEEFAFVDLGSGKGRALLLSLAYPFRDRIGVEFAEELHDIARANLRGKPVTLVCGDATDYDFPQGPLVVYLYNPFGLEVITRIARKLSAHPATLYIAYINPFHMDPWIDSGFTVVARGAPFVILTAGLPADAPCPAKVGRELGANRARP